MFPQLYSLRRRFARAVRVVGLLAAIQILGEEVAQFVQAFRRLPERQRVRGIIYLLKTIEEFAILQTPYLKGLKEKSRDDLLESIMGYLRALQGFQQACSAIDGSYHAIGMTCPLPDAETPIWPIGEFTTLHHRYEQINHNLQQLARRERIRVSRALHGNAYVPVGHQVVAEMEARLDGAICECQIIEGQVHGKAIESA